MHACALYEFVYVYICVCMCAYACKCMCFAHSIIYYVSTHGYKYVYT
jgi:hypothetical protein